jgi:N6-L-threonylcarbamoyladenine synthase
MLNDKNDDFSFSGLKTSVRYFIRDHPEVLQDRRALTDLCASVQEAIVEVLWVKLFRAAERLGVRCITVSGGVACNRRLRERLKLFCEWEKYELRFADQKFCTDNAAMIGILAERKLKHGISIPSLDEEIKPGWVLA